MISKNIFSTIAVIGVLLIHNSRSLGQTVSTLTPDVISISTLNTESYESWTRPATIVIRRSGGVRAVTIPIVFLGTATRNTDYTTTAGSSVTMPMGARELFIQITPRLDALVESTETIQVQLQASTAYTISGANTTSVDLRDASAPLNDEEATRFLIQAGFGADPDELSDVKALGFSAWIDAQIARPKGYLQPIITAKAAIGPVYHPETKVALWTQMMRRRYPSPGVTVNTDILRQRIAYSLLQIFVISQNVDALLPPEGVANYYDRLIDGALGNFRDILYDVTMHPAMGIYLSHRGNRKGNVALNIFPDENYAREIMQLFSIGLWELNNDGTRKLSNGQPIPTYSNVDITNFARVFTGLQYGGPNNDSFEWAGEETKFPMKAYDAFHDQDAKTLLRGQTLAAGRTTLQDINSAIDNLFNHSNTGPFISKLLIQRLVNSNPSPAYVDRVASKFNNNGANVRGDMGAVVKAILMDEEARNYSYTTGVLAGKMREPYMTLMNMGKTFNAQPASNNYESATYMYEFYLQEPFQSPSVFNFYKPEDRPFGEVTLMDKYAPEFKILTAVTAIESQNNLLNSVQNQIARWGASSPANEMKLNFSAELPLANNPDALIRQLSVRMLGGSLQPKTFQIVRDAVIKIDASGSTWQKDRVDMAAYLIAASTEFNIQK